MNKKITRQEAEMVLEGRFKGKFVQFSYPGYPTVYGRCDRVSIGTGVRDRGLILIVIGDQMYKCSPESLNECLTLIKKENGNSHTRGTEPPAGPS